MQPLPMSAWVKAQRLPEEALQQIRGIYGDHFPIEVRHYLAEWIEERLWIDVDPDNPPYEGYIAELVGNFIQEIELRANSLEGQQSFPARMKLMDATNNFKQRYNCNPIGLFNMIKNCLLNERRLVRQFESTSNNSMDCKNSFYVGNEAYLQLHHNIDAVRIQTQEIAEKIRRFDAERESFSLKLFEFQNIDAQIAQIPNRVDHHTQENAFLLNKLKHTKSVLGNGLQEKAKAITAYQVHIVEKLGDQFMKVEVLVKRVIDVELINWKRSQQLAGNGAEFDTGHLDILQTWCECLAEEAWTNLTQTKAMKRSCETVSQQLGDMPDILNALYDLEAKFNKLLSTLVTSTFIIEKQPPQVMKTNTRFSAKIRLLVGGKLNVHMTPPQVKVSIISEAQANQLLCEKILKGDSSGEILNNVGTMEYEQSTKQLSITFRNMQLKKIRRAEKKGSESVVDEKFSLYFSSNFSVGAELDCHVWTLSLPVTVIVHGNQEPHAWATITWDNAFAEPGRKPFAVPEKVSWGKVAMALNTKFRSVTGKELSKDNLNYLAEKLFRATSDDFDPLHTSWAQFSKETLPERNFTFWDWFYAIMKLTREHLKPLWMDGTIHGFLRKRQAEEMLSTCPRGTFLLRFSDSELGGITIAWVAGNGDQPTVTMLQPFTAKDFAIRTLADRLNDLNHLGYLYPDILKDKAFGKYYTPFVETQGSNTNGYVKPILITHIPGLGNSDLNSSFHLSGSLQSFPNTPHSMYHPSSPGDAGSVISEQNISFAGTNEIEYAELMDHVDFPMNFP